MNSYQISHPSYFLNIAEIARTYRQERPTENGTKLIPSSTIFDIEIPERLIKAVSTGFSSLDNCLSGGLYPGELVVVSGHPHQGQEEFLLQLALNLATEQSLAVAYFSLGETDEQVAARIMANIASVDYPRALRKVWREEEHVLLDQALNLLQEMPIFINNFSGLKVYGDVRGCLDKGICGQNIGAVIIDYLQLIQGDGEQVTRREEIGRILEDLKELAEEYDVPIVLRSMLYPYCRGADTSLLPIRADLLNAPETSAIDRVADTIFFLHKERCESQEKDLCVSVEKSSRGIQGSVCLKFDTYYGRICDRDK